MEGVEQALMEVGERVALVWPYVASALAVFIALIASGHVILHKRDVRAAIGWAGLIWLAPVLGGLAYILLGINRIQRRGARVRGAAALPRRRVLPHDAEALERRLGGHSSHLRDVARLADVVTRRPLTFGNRMQPLQDGDEAYPRMLAAIAEASRSVALATYIFDRDPVGLRFVDALAAACRRGVEVRVLVDAAGARYSWPRILHELKTRGVPHAEFLPTRVPWQATYANLRNHRKIAVIDGVVGFTGGMNIRAGHVIAERTAHPVRDLHFQVEGPVVAHLAEVFAEDWRFACGEELNGEAWFPVLQSRGVVAARGISDGPDEDYNSLRWVILGALAAARRSVRIVTPYFLPDWDLITALNLAALRGVQVDIVLPEVSNLRLVQWAAAAQLWQVLERGCAVHLTRPPFDHTKLMVVDQAWSLVGSANWDPRSLRLNFELNLECYDPVLAQSLEELVAERLSRSRRLTLQEVDGRPLPIRLRDGLARLLQPLL
jgi:cardiolipin synthase